MIASRSPNSVARNARPSARHAGSTTPPAPATAPPSWPCPSCRAAAGRSRTGNRPLSGTARAQQIVLGEPEQVTLVGDHLGLQQRGGSLVTEPLDVECAAAGDAETPAPATAPDRSGRWGSGVGVSLQRRRQRGAALGTRGGHVEFALGAVAQVGTTGPSTSGITSPALRIITVSPMRTPLRLTSSALCRVASPTVDPATLTGVMNANGVTRPVRPTLTRMSSSLVCASCGGYL